MLAERDSKPIQIEIPLEMQEGISLLKNSLGVSEDEFLRYFVKLGLTIDSLETKSLPRDPNIAYALGSIHISTNISETNQTAVITKPARLYPSNRYLFGYSRISLILRSEVLDLLSETAIRRSTTPESLLVEFLRLGLEFFSKEPSIGNLFA